MAPWPRFAGTVFFPNSLSHGCDEHTYACQTTVLAFDFENLSSSRIVRARKLRHTVCLLVAESGLVWERTAEVCHKTLLPDTKADGSSPRGPQLWEYWEVA